MHSVGNVFHKADHQVGAPNHQLSTFRARAGIEFLASLDYSKLTIKNCRAAAGSGSGAGSGLVIYSCSP